MLIQIGNEIVRIEGIEVDILNNDREDRSKRSATKKDKRNFPLGQEKKGGEIRKKKTWTKLNKL